MEWIRRVFRKRSDATVDNCAWKQTSLVLAAEVEGLCTAYDRLLMLVQEGSVAPDSPEVRSLPGEIESIRRAAQLVAAQAKAVPVDRSTIVYSDPYNLEDLNLMVIYANKRNAA